MKAGPQKVTASSRKGDAVSVSGRGWLARLLTFIPSLLGWRKVSRRGKKRRRARMTVMYR